MLHHKTSVFFNDDPMQRINFSDDSLQKKVEEAEEKRFEARVKKLEESGMSRHAALTQAGIERSKERLNVDFMELSADQRIILNDIRKTLEEKFTKSVANELTKKLASIFIKNADKDFKNDDAINRVIEETLKEYVAYDDQARQAERIDKLADQLVDQGMDRHTALMKLGQEILK